MSSSHLTVRATRGLRMVSAALALSALVTLPALGQRPNPANDPEMQALAQYRLTESGLNEFMHATQNLATAARQHPAEVKAMAKENQHAKSAQTLSQMAAYFDSHPITRNALRSAGMSGRDFVLFSMATMQAGMSLAFSKMKMKGAKAPPPNLAANMAFYQAHQAQFKQAQEMMKSMGDSAGGH